MPFGISQGKVATVYR